MNIPLSVQPHDLLSGHTQSCDTHTTLHHLSSQSNIDSTYTKQHRPSQPSYALERYTAEQDQYRNLLVQGKDRGGSKARPVHGLVLGLPGQQRGTSLRYFHRC